MALGCPSGLAVHLRAPVPLHQRFCSVRARRCPLAGGAAPHEIRRVPARARDPGGCPPRRAEPPARRHCSSTARRRTGRGPALCVRANHSSTGHRYRRRRGNQVAKPRRVASYPLSRAACVATNAPRRSCVFDDEHYDSFPAVGGHCRLGPDIDVRGSINSP